jgi:transposase-like protein
MIKLLTSNPYLMKKKTLIARYLKRGMRKVEIARKAGVSRNYVYKIINQQNYEKNSNLL